MRAGRLVWVRHEWNHDFHAWRIGRWLDWRYTRLTDQKDQTPTRSSLIPILRNGSCINGDASLFAAPWNNKTVLFGAVQKQWTMKTEWNESSFDCFSVFVKIRKNTFSRGTLDSLQCVEMTLRNRVLRVPSTKLSEFSLDQFRVGHLVDFCDQDTKRWRIVRYLAINAVTKTRVVFPTRLIRKVEWRNEFRYRVEESDVS